MKPEIRRNKKTGELVKTFWYGRKYVGGVRQLFKLAPIKGKPPASWLPSVAKWDMSDHGDKWFEESRSSAEKALQELEANPPKPEEPPSEIEAFTKAYKANHGKKFKAVKIKDVVKVHDKKFAEAGEKVAKTAYAKWEKGILQRFVTWWANSGRSTMIPFHDVTIEDGRDFFKYLGRANEAGLRVKADTLRRMKSYLSRAFHNICPYSNFNPFNIAIETPKDDETIHREALSPKEIDLVLRTAKKEDPVLYELIAAGLCTALRRGDLCGLKWSSISDKTWTYQGEMRRGSIKVKTHKTGALVEIPIFPLLGKVLTKRLSERKQGDVYVFPEAEELNRNHYKQLTKRIKTIYALALAESKGAFIVEVPAEEEPVLSPKEALPFVKKALGTAKLSPAQKHKVETCIDLYAKGFPYNQIVKHTGYNKSIISDSLHKAEKISKTKFIIRPKKTAREIAIAALIKQITTAERKVGMKAGSLYDFPCLRTTFVTLAAKNKVPIEQVRLITGHTDTRMIQDYYNRATGIDYAENLASAMPAALMQDIPAPTQLPVAPSAEHPIIGFSQGTISMSEILKGLSAEEKAKIRTLPDDAKTDFKKVASIEDAKLFLSLY